MRCLSSLKASHSVSVQLQALATYRSLGWTLVEFDKSDKWLDLGHTCWGWPVTNTGHFDRIHLYMTFWKDKMDTLPWVVQTWISWLSGRTNVWRMSRTHTWWNGVALWSSHQIWGCQPYNIWLWLSHLWVLGRCHSLLSDVPGYQWDKEHGLEVWTGLCSSKGCFPLVSLLDPYVVISPLDVQLGEILCLGFGYHIEDVGFRGRG